MKNENIEGLELKPVESDCINKCALCCMQDDENGFCINDYCEPFCRDDGKNVYFIKTNLQQSFVNGADK